MAWRNTLTSAFGCISRPRRNKRKIIPISEIEREEGYDPNDPAGSQEGTPIGTGGEGGEGSQGSDGPAPVGNSGPGGDAGDGGDGGDGSSWGESGTPGANGSPGSPGDGTSATPSAPGDPGEGGGSNGIGGLGGYAILSTTSFNYTGYINTSGSNITIRGSIIGGTLV